MMGHREKTHNGGEVDCVGSPGHRWRDHMPKSHRRWSRVKNQINRRVRRQAKNMCLRALHNSDEELFRVAE